MNAGVFLGDLYRLGQGGPQEFVKAWHLLRSPAEQGHEWAQIVVGEMYALGQGVPQDDVRAYMWWSIALAQERSYQGHVARFNQIEVAKRMTPAHLAKAKRMTREYARARKSGIG